MRRRRSVMATATALAVGLALVTVLSACDAEPPQLPIRPANVEALR